VRVRECAKDMERFYFDLLPASRYMWNADRLGNGYVGTLLFVLVSSSCPYSLAGPLGIQHRGLCRHERLHRLLFTKIKEVIHSGSVLSWSRL
jgi:hypothetical protein